MFLISDSTIHSGHEQSEYNTRKFGRMCVLQIKWTSQRYRNRTLPLAGLLPQVRICMSRFMFSSSKWRIWIVRAYCRFYVTEVAVQARICAIEPSSFEFDVRYVCHSPWLRVRKILLLPRSLPEITFKFHVNLHQIDVNAPSCPCRFDRKRRLGCLLVYDKQHVARIDFSS